MVSGLSPGRPIMNEANVSMPVSLQACTALTACSMVIPFFTRLSISALPDSMPKLTVSQPASRIMVNISASTVFTRAKADQVILMSRRLSSSQKARTRSLLEVKRSSAMFMRLKP